MTTQLNNPVALAQFSCGTQQPLVLIAGPCVIETADMTRRIAEGLQQAVAELPVQLVFKASFDKANRSSLGSNRGPGIEAGLAELQEGDRITVRRSDHPVEIVASPFLDRYEILHAKLRWGER